ncbi:hypothetical protein SLEP1_g1517 [Rubroshorea leprosula]|uniref:Uncharacterized protein n=1 Tax=Rubroshorea leprosula TaxID=152421 RepID=A0AAV5HE16_9ROSI|nr:hypothetical protein SLEP1_g1517 [Rubroshorea leprosula]
MVNKTRGILCKSPREIFMDETLEKLQASMGSFMIRRKKPC